LDVLLQTIAIAAALLTLCGIGYLLASLVGLRRFILLTDRIDADLPPVTVLKPLHGAEPRLYENLASFCRQTHPQFQIVFGVRRSDDPAIEIVRQLQADFPELDLTLVLDPVVHGTNYKVSNLINMLGSAKHEFLVIADSDMAVAPNYLAVLTTALKNPEIGLVTCLYAGHPLEGIWSKLGAAHINHGFFPSVLVGRLVNGRAGCFGATMALRRADLEAIGGLTSLKNLLADDYFLGAKVQALGKKLHLTGMVVDDHVYEPSLKKLFLHELRWARTIRSIAPLDFAGTLVTHPLAWSMVALALSLGESWAIGLCGAAFAVRIMTIRVFDHTLGTPRTPTYLIPIRDLLSFVVLAAAYSGRSVAWRDRWFRVDANGQLVIDGDRPA
jgi:ceramide glucosyltransferase